MRLSEIFYSLQGEGELTGVPSIFIRTSGCNLRCRWCDTKYASWQPEGDVQSVETIVNQIAGYPARHCVITGGEPMVARDLHELTSRLREKDYHLTIETAGTLPPDGIACDLASLSPKLSNSTPRTGEIESSWIQKHEARRLQPDVLREWIDHYPFQLKFVLASRRDEEEMETLLASLDRSIPPHKILIMPEGTTPGAFPDRQAELVNLCKEKGYRFCHRLHLDWFGNTRGT
ncbi:MAG: 7-carboxy-7-deazaguanine synthase QueE [Verrucomicrobiota bacterium]